MSMNIVQRVGFRAAAAAVPVQRRAASTITAVKGREIIDSRGNPTVEVIYTLPPTPTYNE